MRALLLLFDRTAILFLGVAAGAAIGYAFGIRQQPEVPAPVAPMTATANLAGAVEKMVEATSGQPVGADGVPAPIAEPETRPIQPGIVNAIRDGRPVRVGIFGDSFGDGIWSALYDQLSRKSGYQVIKYSQQATGFTRYKTLNLETHDRARLVAAPVDIAVISFGANDMMGVADGGHVYALLTPNWKEAIARRVTSYVAMLRGQGAIVYWVGLPKMRDNSYDANAARMNAFYRDLMQRLGVVYIDTAPYSVDADGRYAAYLTDPATGRPFLMRANDGIHMSFKGYVRITRGLAGRIRNYVDKARAQVGGGAPPPLVPPAAIEVRPPKSPASAEELPPGPDGETEIAPPKPPVAKALPRLEDPLAGQPDAPARVQEAPKGAPIDLLPPEMRNEAALRNESE